MTDGNTQGRPARDIAILAREIRAAWITASAAIQIPASIEKDRVPDFESPHIASILDARHTAFEWALNELIDGGYSMPGDQLRTLALGNLPSPDSREQEHRA